MIRLTGQTRYSIIEVQIFDCGWEIVGKDSCIISEKRKSELATLNYVMAGKDAMERHVVLSL